MGTVYEVADRLTGMLVALKQVTTPTNNLDFSRAGDTGSFELALANEFKILGSLRHPNIVSVLDYGFDQQRLPYFTMDLLSHPKRITELIDQPQGVQIDLLMQLLQALAYLHQRQIIHRDLKPANVLVTMDGQVKVLDFGLALSAEYAKQKSEGFSGTLSYMAPEVLRGEVVTARSDLYAFGVIAYEMLSGQHPFPQENLSLRMMDILNTEPTFDYFNAQITPVLSRLLAKDPDHRYEDADTVIQEFKNATGYQQPLETLAIRESYLQAARFVGREEEIVQLEQFAKEAIAGHGNICLIAGESGVGKSRLLGELRIRTLIENVLVLRGQAVSEGSNPYHVWQDILRWLAILSEITQQEASVLKDIVPDIEDVLQSPIPNAQELSPQAARERLSMVIISLFERLDRAVILMLQDLHWAGEESIALIQRLSSTIQNRPILILGSYRNDEKPDLPSRIPAGQIIQLERFDREQIAALSESILGRVGRKTEIVEFLKRETDGNVFFVVEVVRALAEEAGELSKIATMPLPEKITSGGIVAILRQRLQHLSEDVFALLRLAAVRGRELDLPILSRVAPEVDQQHWLLTCANALILEVEEERWSFTHDKLREQILYDLEKEPEQLRSLHHQIAEAIEAVHANDTNQLAALSHHWTQAGVADKAAYYSEQAAQQMVRSASPEAIQYVEKAMAFDDAIGEISDERNALRHMIVGVTHYYMGNNDLAQSSLEKALDYMGVPPAPAKQWQVALGILKQIHLQIRHRLRPEDYLARRDSDWFEENMFYGLLTMPMIYQARGDLLKGLYSVLVSLNTLESLKPSSVANPIMGYGWMHLVLGMIPIHGLSNYYRSLVTEIIDDEKRVQQVPPLQKIGVETQMTVYDYMNGHWEGGRMRMVEAIPQLQQMGELHSVELAYYVLGLIEELTGRFDNALEAYHAAYAQSRRREDREVQFMLFAALVALRLQINRFNEGEFDDFSLLLDTSAADKLFEKPYKTNRSNKALYTILQANFYIHNKEEQKAWEAVKAAYAITNTLDVDKNTSFLDLYESMAFVCSDLLSRAQAGQALPFGETSEIGKILKHAVKLLNTYSKLLVCARPSALIYEGWEASLNKNLAKAKKNWEGGSSLAKEMGMPYYLVLGHLSLAQHQQISTTERQEHKEQSRLILADLGEIYLPFFLSQGGEQHE